MKFQENRWFGENWWLEGWKEVSLDELRFGFEKRNRPWPDIHHALVTDEASQVRYFPHCCLARSFLKKIIVLIRRGTIGQKCKTG